MTWSEPSQLHRTAKLLIDLGAASSPAEARTILEGLVLQVDVGPELGSDSGCEAALITIVNAGHRALLGGVEVRIESDTKLTVGWCKGLRVSEAIRIYGGRVVTGHSADHPTLVVGEPRRESTGSVVLHVVASGWSGGVVETPNPENMQKGISLAGVMAGALGVSEIFQYCLGSPVAGRRDVGVSLWRPDLHWQDLNGVGPTLRWLPRSLWLLGLGHLGQAYAWSLGWLPYKTPSDVNVFLMDTDSIIDGNVATGLLTRSFDLGIQKTRVVARELESLGFRSTIVERWFDDSFRLFPAEPKICVAGFDDPAPRRLLGGDRFSGVIDGGLGAGIVGYLDILLHTFPSPLQPEMAFGSAVRSTSTSLPLAYEAEIQRRISGGDDEGDARCGMLEFAGVTIGAAFVGAVAGALAISDILRRLHQGQEFSVLGLDLRSPNDSQAAFNTAPGLYVPPHADADESY